MPAFLGSSLQEFAPDQPGFLQLSQAHLTLLTACPRKFQHVYLDQLGLPSLPEAQERQALGTRFHQLMQQRELGLPIEGLTQADGQLRRWFDAFNNTSPKMLVGDRQCEHCRVLSFQRYLLTGVYDLLILAQQRAQILDWKTYSRPQNPEWLEQHWQTRLYLYLLAETSNYPPEQISMTYWFAESRHKETEPHITFTYNTARHTRTQQDLTQLLGNLTDWLERYNQGSAFPQIEREVGECDGRRASSNPDQDEPLWCRFAIRCQRRPESKAVIVPTAHIDQIQELPL